MAAAETSLASVANNLANAHSAGFKQSFLDFATQSGGGVRTAGTSVDTSHGTIDLLATSRCISPSKGRVVRTPTSAATCWNPWLAATQFCADMLVLSTREQPVARRTDGHEPAFLNGRPAGRIIGVMGLHGGTVPIFAPAKTGLSPSDE